MSSCCRYSIYWAYKQGSICLTYIFLYNFCIRRDCAFVPYSLLTEGYFLGGWAMWNVYCLKTLLFWGLAAGMGLYFAFCFYWPQTYNSKSNLGAYYFQVYKKMWVFLKYGCLLLTKVFALLKWVPCGHCTFYSL